MRFLFVGDSQTIGRAGDHTWRYRMWQHLSASYGGPFRIVGPRDGLYDPSADAPVSYAYADPEFPLQARRHLAGWGEGWQHMVPLVGDAVRSGKAQVLLVALGLIDLGFYTNSEQTAENVHRFFAAAREANPRVRAVVLPVIPNIRAEADPSFAEEVDRFNMLLAKAVADLDTPGSPLLLASLPDVPEGGAYGPDGAGPGAYDIHRDTYDGTHPGPSGEHKIAAAFATALHQGWDLGGPYEGV